jgi:hypothetical protein
MVGVRCFSQVRLAKVWMRDEVGSNYQKQPKVVS